MIQHRKRIIVVEDVGKFKPSLIIMLIVTLVSVLLGCATSTPLQRVEKYERKATPLQRVEKYERKAAIKQLNRTISEKPVNADAARKGLRQLKELRPKPRNVGDLPDRSVMEPRIVNGVFTFGFPAVVALLDDDGVAPRMSCSGTLIGCDTVLTARHCVDLVPMADIRNSSAIFLELRG